ncbi:LysR family transcriptional regulator [Streptomyces triticirhizae]|uniref:LysR family transcriptional regulator n=1 Tax=Streptomyces triticirhizae TaxID=2483353 RepID=A0A3M2M1Q1_9ACTN|nr:LysR substrate-binding domain-containing protein [Streptomyces triticirhizae]RMI43547.1 LysR family transcriptional regulator [Streptomyces triticirhizae]
MQLQQLRYFTAVAETRHFTRAASREHVSQPSLSQQIRALERELGAELFHRARGHISLTDAGTALLPLARRILADTETARREVQEVAQLRRGRVRLGAPPSLCASLVPDVLRDFRDRYPGIELLVHEDGSQDLVRALAAGELDLALVITPLTGQAPALATRELLREELVVISPPADVPPTGSGSAGAGGAGAVERGPLPDGPIAIEELRDRPLVMFRHGYDLRELTLAACHAAGFEPSFSVAGGEMDAVLSFVRAGLGLAVVPSMVAERSGLRTTRFVPPGLNRTISLAHRGDVSPPRAARELRRIILAHSGLGPAGP